MIRNLIFPDNGFHDADDLGISAVNGVVVIIFGHQPDLAVAAAQPLDGGFVTDPRHHDLTVAGGLLGAHHHFVSAEDAGTHHTVAPDTEGKAAGLAVPGHGAFLVFIGQDGNAGRDHADHRDLAGTGAGNDAALAALFAGGQQQTLVLQCLDMVADGGGGAQTYGSADLPNRRGVAILLNELIHKG